MFVSLFPWPLFTTSIFLKALLWPVCEDGSSHPPGVALEVKGLLDQGEGRGATYAFCFYNFFYQEFGTAIGWPTVLFTGQMCLLCLVKCCSCYLKSLLRMDLDPVIFLQGQRFTTQSIIWMIYCEMLACILDIMKVNTPGKHKICAACRRFCLTAGRFPTYTWKFFGSGAQMVKSNKKDQRIGGQGRSPVCAGVRWGPRTTSGIIPHETDLLIPETDLSLTAGLLSG